MSDAPFRSPATLRTARPGDVVWTLQKEACVLRGELHDHGEAAVCEFRVLSNGHFLFGHRHATRAIAQVEAAATRRHLEADGWASSVSDAGR